MGLQGLKGGGYEVEKLGFSNSYSGCEGLNFSGRSASVVQSIRLVTTQRVGHSLRSSTKQNEFERDPYWVDCLPAAHEDMISGLGQFRPWGNGYG